MHFALVSICNCCHFKSKIISSSLNLLFDSQIASCNTGLLDDIFKVKKRCVRLILDSPFQARTLPLVRKYGNPSIREILVMTSPYDVRTYDRPSHRYKPK